MITPWDWWTAWREAREGHFAWKVRWRMQHDRNPLLITLQDKYAAKEYARRRGVAPVELLHVTDQPETLPFASLPADYFIKASHGCGWNIACLDGQLYQFVDGSRFVRADGTPARPAEIARYRISRADCIELGRRWLGKRYRRNEWAYQHIPPRLVVEAAVRQHGGGALREYKIFTMDGRVRAIKVAGLVFRRTDSDNLFFDADWQPFKLTRQRVRINTSELGRRPERLPELVAAAERLGEGLDFLRVDLYDTTQGVRLGELTVYPSAEKPGRPTSCPVFNKWLGDQWVLPDRGLPGRR